MLLVSFTVLDLALEIRDEFLLGSQTRNSIGMSWRSDHHFQGSWLVHSRFDWPSAIRQILFPKMPKILIRKLYLLLQRICVNVGFPWSLLLRIHQRLVRVRRSFLDQIVKLHFLLRTLLCMRFFELNEAAVLLNQDWLVVLDLYWPLLHLQALRRLFRQLLDAYLFNLLAYREVDLLDLIQIIALIGTIKLEFFNRSWIILRCPNFAGLQYCAREEAIAALVGDLKIQAAIDVHGWGSMIDEFLLVIDSFNNLTLRRNTSLLSSITLNLFLGRFTLIWVRLIVLILSHLLVEICYLWRISLWLIQGTTWILSTWRSLNHLLFCNLACSFLLHHGHLHCLLVDAVVLLRHRVLVTLGRFVNSSQILAVELLGMSLFDLGVVLALVLLNVSRRFVIQRHLCYPLFEGVIWSFLMLRFEVLAEVLNLLIGVLQRSRNVFVHLRLLPGDVHDVLVLLLLIIHRFILNLMDFVIQLLQLVQQKLI